MPPEALTATAPQAKAIPRRVTLAEYFDDALTDSRWVCLELSCGHWQYERCLPSGFATIAALTDAQFGCPECAIGATPDE